MRAHTNTYTSTHTQHTHTHDNYALACAQPPRGKPRMRDKVAGRLHQQLASVAPGPFRRRSPGTPEQPRGGLHENTPPPLVHFMISREEKYQVREVGGRGSAG